MSQGASLLSLFLVPKIHGYDYSNYDTSEEREDFLAVPSLLLQDSYRL